MNIVSLRLPRTFVGGPFRAERATSFRPTAAELSWPALMAAALHAAVIAALVLWAPNPPPDTDPIVVSLEFVTPAEAPPPEPEPSPPEPEAAFPPKEPPPKQVDIPKPKPKPTPPPLSPAPPRPAEPSPTPPTSSVAAAPAFPVLLANTTDPSYVAILLRWLERFREYPRHARLHGIEGTVTLSLTLARSGSVATVKIHATSGDAILDAAALAMARNADPFPPFPGISALNRAEFLVPVVFVLR